MPFAEPQITAVLSRGAWIWVAWFLVSPVGTTACSATLATERERESEMEPQTTIEAVLERHRDRLMAIPGVVGTGVGDCTGKRCIKLFVMKRTPELSAAVPASLEGFSVAVEEVGEIRALEGR